MQQQIDFSHLGGLYTYQDTLEFMQGGYQPVLDALGAMLGNNLILTGCNVVGGAATAGWVVISGEILPFAGGSVTDYVFVDDVTASEQFDDGISRSVYETKVVRFTDVGSGGARLFSSLVRLPFAATTIKAALNSIQTLFTNIINLEPAVIISGCEVSDVNTGLSTLVIAGGLVSFGPPSGDGGNGALVSAPPYAGGYPAYLQADGTYTTVEPGAGTFITFDPYTSQYYMDVLFRNQHRTGDVVMQTTSATLNSFDVATGLGKWRWLGWKLCDTLASRVPLGYDRRTSAGGDAAWDAAYNTPGNPVGEKAHTLTNAETPNKSVTIPTTGYSGIGGSGTRLVGNAATPTGPDLTLTINSGGGGAHENRQPSRVVLFIEKI